MSTTPQTSEPQPNARTRRTIPPLVFVFLVLVGLAVALGVFIALMAGFDDSEPASTALQEVTMPDGSILALEAVTFGKNHEYEFELPSEGFSFFPVSNRQRLGRQSSDESTVVWFSCREASGRRRDFDWWSHAAVVDRDGNEIRDKDAEAQRFLVMTSNSEGGGGGVRPFPAAAASSRGEPIRKYIVYSVLPRLRHDGDTFPLRIYDRSGKMVGEFKIKDPSPANGKYPEWKAEELPITRTIDGLKVTLATLRIDSRKQSVSSSAARSVRMRHNLFYQFLYEEHGRRNINWDDSMVFLKDALGNEIRQHGDAAGLSDTESVWMLTADFYRNDKEELFDQSELWIVEGVVPAAAGRQKILRKKDTVRGVTLELYAVGGPGTITYRGLLPKGRNGYGRSGEIGGNFGTDTRPKVPYQVDIEGARGLPGNLVVKCDLPHILVRWTGQGPRQRIRNIIATDEEGRPVDLWGPYPGQVLAFPKVYFIRRPHDSETQEPARKLNFKFVVNEARSAEFPVKPLQAGLQPTIPRQSRSPAQRLEATKKAIAQYEKNLAGRPDDPRRNNALAWAIVTAPEKLRTAERIRKAVECAQIAVKAKPESRAWVNTLGMALLRDGRAEEAAVQFKKNLALPEAKTADVDDLYGLVLAQVQSGDMEEARKTFETSVKKHRMFGRYLRGKHDVLELREEVQTALLGENPRTIIESINELIEAGDRDSLVEAIDASGRLLSVYRHDGWQWFSSATLSANMGNRDVWEKHCRRMIELFRDSDDPLTLNRVGKACLLLDGPEDFRGEARRAIERANALQPNEMSLVLSRVLSRFRDEKYSEAMAAANATLAFETRPASADVCVHGLTAMCHFQLGDKEAAANSLAEAEKISRENSLRPIGEPIGPDWPNIFVAAILLREARSLMAAESEAEKATSN